MAVVKAKAEITIYKVTSVEKTTRYYLLQSSTATAPSKPADGAAISGSWSKTEPTYSSGSTNTLYFVDQTILSDGTIKYSEVSKSSSYEAAKEAWNKANNAQNTANSANSKIDGLEIGGRNLARNTSKHVIVTGSGKPQTNFCPNIYEMSCNYQDLIGETVMLSFDYIVTGGTSTAYGALGENVSPWNRWGRMDLKTDGTKHVSATAKISSDVGSSNIIGSRFDNFTGKVEIYNLKLEKGNKATDWTPAPEDVEESTEEAKKMATDYITQDNTGMTVGNKQYDRDIHISPTEINIRKNKKNLARFADSLIELGLSKDFVLQILNNAIRFIGSDGSAAIAHIGYGDCRALPDTSGEEEADVDYVIASRPYYTLGIRADNNAAAPYSEPDISEQASSSDIGEYSVAIGQGVEASGPNSYAEGHLTVASGYVSHAEGDKTEALGSYTHAEGVGTKAHKDISHAEGSGSEAIGFTSHAEGNSTVASGEYSHSEGDNTKASGAASHAAGRGTIADNDAQTAVGKYNTKQSSNLFAVGNGTADDARKDAFAVNSDGQTFTASNVHAGGNFIADKNNQGVYLKRTDGNTVHAMTITTDNSLLIGWGQWDKGNDTLIRAGSDLLFGVKNYNSAIFRPYYRKGDSITMQWRGAGYITASSSMVWFAVPFSKPVIGGPTVTVTSVDGLILRQSGKYVCGTAASTWKKPASIQCSRQGDFLYIGCKMSATTNVVNDDSVGIQASIKITFS